MILQIQPDFICENCIKCGKRPHIEQHKRFWIITCPNHSCKNQVKSSIVDFATWNKLNKKAANLKTGKNPETLKHTA